MRTLCKTGIIVVLALALVGVLAGPGFSQAGEKVTVSGML